MFHFFGVVDFTKIWLSFKFFQIFELAIHIKKKSDLPNNDVFFKKKTTHRSHDI